MKYYVFYHSADLDGFGSMYLIEKYFAIRKSLENPDIDKVPKAKKLLSDLISQNHDEKFLPVHDLEKVVYIPYNYGDDISHIFDVLQPDDGVIFADCLAYQDTDPITVLDIAKKLNKGNVYIFDHHATAINYLGVNSDVMKEYDVHVQCISNVEGSAILLVWNTLFNRHCTPKWAALISRYDTWNKADGDWEDETFPFQQYLRHVMSINPDCSYFKPETAKNLFQPLEDYSSDDYLDVFKCGKLIAEVLTARNIAVWERTGFVAKVVIPEYNQNKVFIAAICSDYNQSSAIFEDAIKFKKLDPEGIDLWILATYDFKGQKHFQPKDGSEGILEISGFRLTIYSKNPDYPSGDIARSLGGGGHAGAAGTPTGNPKHIVINKDPGDGEYTAFLLNMAPGKIFLTNCSKDSSV
jgi:oligoribonuclease NrnB/cAMP/cGMP phosphodiesterase (DHH superfamily)